MIKKYLQLCITLSISFFILRSPGLLAQQISDCPASPYPISVIQADGTSLTIVAKGGMLNSWTETVDGYSIIEKGGIYQYANKQKGILVPSGIAAKNPKERKSTERQILLNRSKSLRPNPTPFINKAVPNNSTLNTSSVQNIGYPPEGNVKALLLLIKYPDLVNTYSPTNLNNMMNQSNYNGTGSFKDFFTTSSFGKLNVSTDVYGWYTAKHNYTYYGYNNGYYVSTELVREAVDAAHAAGVNFSKYDNDGDGVVDGVIVAHAGAGAEEGRRGQYIWSHRWVLSAGGNQVSYDGVLVNDYIMNPETRTFTGQMVGKGVFCHEFGHNLGLPDLYDTDGGSEGIGEWSLMASAGWLGNELTPGNMDAWCRSQLGWVKPVLLNKNGSRSLSAASTSSEVYRINTMLPNEYFLLENRQKKGLDISLKGSGLAIFHINSDQYGNSNENLKLVDLEEADGLDDLDNQNGRGDEGDLYPGSSGRTVFGNASYPNSKTYTNANTNIYISNISIDGSGKALFKVSLTGEPAIQITSPVAGASYTAPASIKISAATSGFSDSIRYVQFFNGANLLNTDSTAPYTYTWTNVAAGNYAITTKAKDYTGSIITSATVSVSVLTNKKPVISITSPANNATFIPPASFILTAQATDSDGSISQVQFYNDTTLLGTDTKSPYNYSAINLPAGKYSFTAKAFDNTNKSATSEVINVSVNYNSAPLVKILSPSNNSNYYAPATFTITASASDADSAVKKVQFYNNGVLLQTDSISPYTYTIANAKAGTYSLVAKATDNKGLSSNSASVNVSVVTSPNKAPQVNITSPANNAVYPSGSSVTINAAATDADGSIVSVNFYNGVTLLKSDSTNPFSYVLNTSANSAYKIYATATDNRGLSNSSATVSIFTGSAQTNKTPEVSISSPSNNAAYFAPANITINAAANDVDGTVSKVQFYSNGNLVETDTVGPYTYTLKNPVPGNYSFVAKAFDNSGFTNNSASVSVSVSTSPNKAPVVALNTPAADTLYYAPASIILKATASDADGSITNVKFFNGTTLLKTDSVGPYTQTLNSVPAGSYSYIAKATDDKGSFNSSASIHVTVAANKAPVISLSTGDSIYTAPATISMSAQASDSDGTVNYVAFYNGTTVIGVDSAKPYTYSWTTVPGGTYLLTAKAVDNHGSVSTSAAVQVIVKTSSSLEAEDAVLVGAVVASASTGFTGAGYADYVHPSGDYIEWTVNAATVGVYTLKFRYANGVTTNRPLQLQINGVVINAGLDFLPTGSWTTWTISSSNANLIAGSNKIRLTSIGLNGANLDNLVVVAYNASLEAEDAVLSGAVVATTATGYTGSAYADYVNASGDYIEWTANITNAGSYSLIFRYANGSANRPLQLQVNGVPVNPAVNFLPTGSWNSWSTSAITANLLAGPNKIRLTTTGANGPNVDNLTLTGNSSTQAIQNLTANKRIAQNSARLLSARVSPNPVTSIAKLIVYTTSGPSIDMTVVDASGRNHKAFSRRLQGSNTYDLPIKDLAAGTYTVILHQGNLYAYTTFVVLKTK